MSESLNVPETPQPDAQPVIDTADIAAPPKPLWYWVKRVLACNPFYLVSAALLLYGIYRVSADPNFLSKEVAQLFFNFTSLQLYEALLVTTAIFLARRRIWYDSTLLAGLENLLLLVPFILISQAALIEPWMVWTMCLAGGLLAVARFGALKRWFAELNLPGRLLGAGAVVLAVNVALPVVYRVLHEHKFGTKPDWGAAYHTNQYAWWLALPALCALVNLLTPTQRGRELLPQRRWLPQGFLALWLAGTATHLYCLGYVYDFTLRPEFLAPAAWVLLWTLRQRAADFLPGLKPAWRDALLVPPLLATVLAAPQLGKQVFLILTVLNLAVYAGICAGHRGHRLALHLMFISLAALIGGLPEDWVHSLAAGLSRAKCLGAGAALYCLLCAAFSRNPQMGLFGALVSAIAILAVWGERPQAFHWAVETALAFLLLHSLRWVDAEHAGAAAFRLMAGLAWAAHAFVWLHLGGAAWMACAIATPVLAGYVLARFVSRRWGPWIVPLAGFVVLVSGPGDFTAGKVQSAPVGLLAVIGSFLLFGVGTLAALTKQHWHKET